MQQRVPWTILFLLPKEGRNVKAMSRHCAGRVITQKGIALDTMISCDCHCWLLADAQLEADVAKREAEAQAQRCKVCGMIGCCGDATCEGQPVMLWEGRAA